MKMRTEELTGKALDWAVAKCENFDTRNNYRVWVTQEKGGQLVFDCYADDWEHAYEQAQDAYPNHPGVAAAEPLEDYSPSTDWSQGGPIIEREEIFLAKSILGGWTASIYTHDERVRCTLHEGKTPLIAAMRCYVASKLGGTVEIPEELI